MKAFKEELNHLRTMSESMSVFQIIYPTHER